MAKVITLDGLRNGTLQDLGKAKLGRARCRKTIRVYSPALEQEVDICEEDAVRVAQRAGGMTTSKRRRGRPRGSTIKSGAKRPVVRSGSTTKVVRNKRGRKVCRCSDPNNTQILPHASCGLPTKGKCVCKKRSKKVGNKKTRCLLRSPKGCTPNGRKKSPRRRRRRR